MCVYVEKRLSRVPTPAKAPSPRMGFGCPTLRNVYLNLNRNAWRGGGAGMMMIKLSGPSDHRQRGMHDRARACVYVCANGRINCFCGRTPFISGGPAGMRARLVCVPHLCPNARISRVLFVNVLFRIPSIVLCWY